VVRKVLIYPVLVFLILLLSAGFYVLSADKKIRYSDIRIESASVRAPMPGQSVGVLYFHIINTGGANELLSVSTPVSGRVELHTVLQDNDIMRMRRVETVKIQALATTKFERGGLHVMLFDAKIPKDMQNIPVTLTFAHPPIPVSAGDRGKEKDNMLTVYARLENQGLR